jgi:hypothetical protein
MTKPCPTTPKPRPPRKGQLTIETAADMLVQISGRVDEDAGPIILARHFDVSVEDFGRFVGVNADAVVAAMDAIKAYRAPINARRKLRRRTDPVFALTYNARARFNMVLKAQGVRKAWPTFQSFGYSPDELRDHLTPMLKPGMTWANYGRVWHVDHKRPVASFNFAVADPLPVIRECWALTNLQPLFAPENIAKGARYAA